MNQHPLTPEAIDTALQLVNGRVRDFADVAAVPYQTAAVYLTFSQQLNYLRWLETRLIGFLEDYDKAPRIPYAELLRQKRIVSRYRAQFEQVLADMQKAVTRPLPEFAAVQMMDWVMEQGNGVGTAVPVGVGDVFTN